MHRVEELKDPTGLRTSAAASPSGATQEVELTSAVLDLLDIGVVVVDDRRRLVRANAASSAILGVDLSSATGTGEWWHPLHARRSDDGTPLVAAATVLRTGEVLRHVGVAITRPDGTVVSLDVDYLPLRPGPGPVTGVVLTFRDVTELSRLQMTQQRLREAHEVARLTSWEWYPETDEIVRFDARVKDTGRLEGDRGTLEELLAQMPVEHARSTREDLARFVRGDCDESVRLNPRVISGRGSWLETRSLAVRAPDGRLLSVRGTSQDVTEQELARRELIATRDFFQATLDSAAPHIAVLDETGEVLTTNRPWKEFGAANGLAPGPLGNYLAICDAAAGDEAASSVAAGLRAIAAGERREFVLEYPCHGGGGSSGGSRCRPHGTTGSARRGWSSRTWTSPGSTSIRSGSWRRRSCSTR